MQRARFESIYRGLSNIARKVYDAVPIGDAWSKALITQEIRRVTKTSTDARVIDGCLSSLVENGLVREPTRGAFVRVKVVGGLGSLKVSSSPEVENMAVKSEKVEKLSLRLAGLVTTLTSVAEEIESISIEVDAQLSAVGDELGKLRQLKSLLKDLG
ncbi:hypothetical protein [Chitinibacter sp. GC72]|uniref:hypothetical protein n=1 Tax=Chitinibacter sp. GC72 TaxID=1526917 RepID=UPI0012F7E709|nr:hypothetical protein [Chitinibacter sp. GC72]